MEDFYKNWLKTFAAQRQEYFENDNEKHGDREHSGDGDDRSKENEISKPSDIVYENNFLQMIVEKSAFKSQKVFRLQDHLFKFKVIQKQPTSSLLLSDLFDFLHAALLHVLDNIKLFYKKEDHNVAYLTLHQDPMINGLNTGDKIWFH